MPKLGVTYQRCGGCSFLPLCTEGQALASSAAECVFEQQEYKMMLRTFNKQIPKKEQSPVDKFMIIQIAILYVKKQRLERAAIGVAQTEEGGDEMAERYEKLSNRFYTQMLRYAAGLSTTRHGALKTGIASARMTFAKNMSDILKKKKKRDQANVVRSVPKPNGSTVE